MLHRPENNYLRLSTTLKYIFLENEDFIQYADFTNSVVYLLNKTRDDMQYPDELIINEISEDLTSTSAMKLPAMMSYANEHYLENYSVTTTVMNKETNEEQEQTEFTEPFEYEVYTNDKSKYYVQVCVCDEASIKTIADNKVETENAEPQAF